METMNGVSDSEQDYFEFVEVDPTGRYGRYNEILGKGASKTVYRAFDEHEGIEVAWNQVKLHDFLQKPEDLERLYCEIHLLKTLKHKNIMKFYSSWVDTANRNINFITEMFTSGTLRQYRLKHRRVNIRAVKHWCRQILKGLLYLHSLSPPVIHRDLKCDNIFINGNQGEVKIGDLGLAAILRKSHAEHCVGTPEFMAPEVYEEEYNELVDIYAFGMCILEMVTFEYPYSECTHAAQIYKKVISGKKPEALYKVEDLEVREFVEKCLATVCHRLTARELLEDSFLLTDGYDYEAELDEMSPFLAQTYLGIHQNHRSLVGKYGYHLRYEPENHFDFNPVKVEMMEIDIFPCQEDEHLRDVDITIQGRRREDNDIFLRLRIADKEGRIRNIYFPFDIDNDSALSVATEMVNELDITDQDVTRIANMIDGEISALVPEWKRGFELDEDPHCSDNTSTSLCHNCALNGSPLLDYVTSENSGAKNLQVLEFSKHANAGNHGRFEEVTYQVDGSEATEQSCQPNNGIRYTDIWAQRDRPELGSGDSRDIYCDEANDSLNALRCGREERIIAMDSRSEVKNGNLRSHLRLASLDECGNVIRQELRWLKAKYQLQLRELRDKQLRLDQKPPSLALSLDCPKHKEENKSSLLSLGSPPLLMSRENKMHALKCSPSFKYFGSSFLLVEAEKRCSDSEGLSGSCSPDQMFTAKSFYLGDFIPQPLHRATSLPVDAIDF